MNTDHGSLGCIFDLFTIGIGPSSSHTVGPMRAAQRFAAQLGDEGISHATERIQIDLYGSLGATGRGHQTDVAVLLGLEGEQPETVVVAEIARRVAAIRRAGRLLLNGVDRVAFDEETDLRFRPLTVMDRHPNALRFVASGAGRVLLSRTYYSVGGGYVIDDTAAPTGDAPRRGAGEPYPFTTGTELLGHCRTGGLSISDVVLANERCFHRPEEIEERLGAVWAAMQECVEAGSTASGYLPGALKVERRAAALAGALEAGDGAGPWSALDWVNVWAIAVNEQNASGGRVVTAPTNGAAGVIPAVLYYYQRYGYQRSGPRGNGEGVIRFLATAAGIGLLCKKLASISGAELGCQGEIGSACAMAAAGLCEVLGGDPARVENAAEIGIEHNLGLTCDPVGGLVQIPCIERNAMGAVKAINAAHLALRGSGSHMVSLDVALATMRSTGRDMDDKYKETSRGGLAVNVVEC